MTKDEIAKLPTPVCDNAENKQAWRSPNTWITELEISWRLSRSLEQRLATAVNILDGIAARYDLYPSERETLAEIRGDK